VGGAKNSVDDHGVAEDAKDDPAGKAARAGPRNPAGVADERDKARGDLPGGPGPATPASPVSSASSSRFPFSFHSVFHALRDSFSRAPKLPVFILHSAFCL